MTRAYRILLGSLLASGAAIPAAALAQASPTGSNPSSPSAEPAPESQPVSDEDLEGEEIVVVGRRDPNAVIGDIPPENQLSPADIRSYGATSVEELLDAISPQTVSSRGREGGGRPIVLLNGKRISGFREIRDLPPEAILRLDILPEEVALKYGYRADQRVVNIVLRPRFRSTTAQLEGGIPTEGGTSQGKVDLTRLMIGENGRTTLNAHAERTSALTEAERDIRFEPDDPADVDPRGFRTLIGSRRLARLGGTVNRTMLGDVSSTFDGQVEYSDGRGLLGPSLVYLGDPLMRDTNNLSGHAGLALNGNKATWRWSLTGGYDVQRSETDTDRENDLLGFLTDHARSVSHSGNLDAVVSGPFATLPAGRANVTARLGADTRSLDSRASRFGVVTESSLTRREASGSLNIDVPVAKRGGALSKIGNLTLNANAEVERLSDFGTLTTWGAGAFWSPLEQVNLITSFTAEEGAPSLAQLGNPYLETPNSRIFDFVTGRDATVILVSGGNPDLRSDSRRVLKVGGTIRPLKDTDLELRADFTRSRLKNPISNFPGVTAAVVAAFPDRFQRDAEGNLVRADLRPINGESYARDEIRWGFNFSKPLKSARPTAAQIEQFRHRAAESGQPLPSPPQGDGERSWSRGGSGGGGGGFGRWGGGGFGGRQGGRLQLSLFHTVLLKDESRLAPGLPLIDFLGGQAPEGGSGRAQHRIEANGGYFNNGFGARVSANWQSGSLVTGGQSGGLRFTPLTKINASLFANLGQRFDLVAKHPWLRGSNVRLSVDNIFDAKQKVRDGARLVRINYQPDLLDPQGRTIRLSIRKQFLPPPSFYRRNWGTGGGRGRSPASAEPAPAGPATSSGS